MFVSSYALQHINNKEENTSFYKAKIEYLHEIFHDLWCYVLVVVAGSHIDKEKVFWLIGQWANVIFSSSVLSHISLAEFYILHKNWWILTICFSIYIWRSSRFYFYLSYIVLWIIRMKNLEVLLILHYLN